jgi:hypothetical protein
MVRGRSPRFDHLASDRGARYLADDEQAAAGLCVSEKQQLVRIDGGVEVWTD